MRLAAEKAAPRFEPHLTLGIRSSADNDLQKALARCPAKPIELRLRGVDCSAQFTKTLFVRLEFSLELKELRQSLGLCARGFDPHLSLLYKKLPMHTKRQLAALIWLPFSTVTFDTVQIVRCPSPTATRRDVESWEMLALRRLEATS